MSNYNIISLKKPGLPATCPNQICKWRQKCVIAIDREAQRPVYVPKVNVSFADISQSVWLTCLSFEEES